MAGTEELGAMEELEEIMVRASYTLLVSFRDSGLAARCGVASRFSALCCSWSRVVEIGERRRVGPFEVDGRGTAAVTGWIWWWCCGPSYRRAQRLLHAQRGLHGHRAKASLGQLSLLRQAKRVLQLPSRCRGTGGCG